MYYNTRNLYSRSLLILILVTTAFTIGCTAQQTEEQALKSLRDITRTANYRPRNTSLTSKIVFLKRRPALSPGCSAPVFALKIKTSPGPLRFSIPTCSAKRQSWLITPYGCAAARSRNPVTIQRQ